VKNDKAVFEYKQVFGAIRIRQFARANLKPQFAKGRKFMMF
jgi:hypothetical protein